MQNLGGGGGGQTKCIMGNSKIENGIFNISFFVVLSTLMVLFVLIIQIKTLRGCHQALQ